MSWEREALGTEVESRSCGALGNSFGSVLMGEPQAKKQEFTCEGVLSCFGGFFLLVSLFVCGSLFCFLRKNDCFFPQSKQ